MPIRSYLGPAKLVAGSREEPVTVQLVDRGAAPGRREWGGQVRLAGDLLWDMLSSGDVRLRIGDEEGPVAVVRHGGISGTAEVRGLGAAPF